MDESDTFQDDPSLSLDESLKRFMAWQKKQKQQNRISGDDGGTREQLNRLSRNETEPLAEQGDTEPLQPGFIDCVEQRKNVAGKRGVTEPLH
ncbi:hypothetical protein HPB50_027885 [Hyalomma asiaticum]|nr:hypothetical protein HPB50_027885 [Hyalomma asiaticum]